MLRSRCYSSLHCPCLEPVIEAAASILQPLYEDLHAASLPESSVPEKLAVGFTAPSAGEVVVTDDNKRDLEELYATPEHLRGLDRVVDPDAPLFMASR